MPMEASLTNSFWSEFTLFMCVKGKRSQGQEHMGPHTSHSCTWRGGGGRGGVELKVLGWPILVYEPRFRLNNANLLCLTCLFSTQVKNTDGLRFCFQFSFIHKNLREEKSSEASTGTGGKPVYNQS